MVHIKKIFKKGMTRKLRCIFNCLRSYRTVFQSGFILLHFQQQWWKSQLLILTEIFGMIDLFYFKLF